MNKYVQLFRESCQKLKEDIGNPSIMQAIDYDIDNAELHNKINDIFFDLVETHRQLNELVKKYPNKKLKAISDKLYDIANHLGFGASINLENDYNINNKINADNPFKGSH